MSIFRRNFEKKIERMSIFVNWKYQFQKQFLNHVFAQIANTNTILIFGPIPNTINC